MLAYKAAEPRGRPAGTVHDWFDVREKPVGGFARLSVHQVLLVAWARMAGLVSPFEFRLWWAAVEVRERRATAARERRGRPAVPNDFGNYAEWAGLLGSGGGEKTARRAFKRLHRLGLLSCSRESLRLIESPDELSREDLSGYWELLERVGLAGKRAQPLPVPRSMVRLLAGGLSRAVAFTMLGVVLRCLRRRKLSGSWMCVSGGLVSATWISEAFLLGEATVKHAFKHLRSLSWLVRLETPQWVQQRYGGKTLINLDWRRPLEEQGGESESTPRTAENSALSTPPRTETKNSLRDKKTKNPVGPDRTGFSAERFRKEKPPSLKHLVIEDLRSTPRLLSIFEQALGAGLVGAGYGQQLNFFAAAEHSLVKGTRNPCGLFVHILKNKLWHYCTNDDEDAANERLKRHFFGNQRPREAEPVKRRAVQVVLSDDAKLVAAVQRVAMQHRLPEPFYVLRRERPEWTRDRWDKALAEIENARFRRLAASTAEHGDEELVA